MYVWLRVYCMEYRHGRLYLKPSGHVLLLAIERTDQHYRVHNLPARTMLIS